MIDFSAIEQAIFDAAVEALGGGAALVEARAKQRAPVRKLFSEPTYSIRLKTAAEIEVNREAHARVFKPIAQALGKAYQPEVYGEARIATGKRPPVRWHQRSSPQAEALLAQYDAEMSRRKAGLVPTKTVLSREGASEIRTKRAAFTTWKHRYIGGRLRGEIYSTDVKVDGRHAEAWVISPTPYAKYQEFGTRHNAAHPFLRPAAEESRSEVVSRIAAAIRRASRTGSSDVDIEIVVRL